MTGPDRPLRIAHVVVTDAFAGVERYVCQVAGELAARGHRVVTVGGDQRRMRAELPDAVTSRPADGLLAAAWALATDHGVDIVHAHMTAAEGAAWLSRPLHRSRIVATRHFAQDRGSSRLARSLAAVTSRSIVRDIAISQFVADSISGPALVIPNGVPVRPQAPLEAPTIVMLQRLEAEKAPELGLAAFAESGLGGEGWRLEIAGTGALQPALERRAEELGVAASTVFSGQVADTDRLLAGASVFLAPGHLDGFGLSVVEAMAHGLPVVAAAGGGHRETVGEDGLLFPPGDAPAAGAALARLGGDPGLRHTVGAALRRRQQSRYSLPRHVDRLEEVYREVAGWGTNGPHTQMAASAPVP